MVENGLSSGGQRLADEHCPGQVDETRPGAVQLVVVVAFQQAGRFEGAELS